MLRAGLGLLLAAVDLYLVGLQIWCIDRRCKSLRMRNAWAWIIASFVSLANLVCLLLLIHRATQFLRANAVQVGILGARG